MTTEERKAIEERTDGCRDTGCWLDIVDTDTDIRDVAWAADAAESDRAALLDALRLSEMAAKGLADEHIEMGRTIARQRRALYRQAGRVLRLRLSLASECGPWSRYEKLEAAVANRDSHTRLAALEGKEDDDGR